MVQVKELWSSGRVDGPGVTRIRHRAIVESKKADEADQLRTAEWTGRFQAIRV